jgi:hypothetical protein
MKRQTPQNSYNLDKYCYTRIVQKLLEGFHVLHNVTVLTHNLKL